MLSTKTEKCDLCKYERSQEPLYLCTRWPKNVACRQYKFRVLKFFLKKTVTFLDVFRRLYSRGVWQHWCCWKFVLSYYILALTKLCRERSIAIYIYIYPCPFYVVKRSGSPHKSVSLFVTSAVVTIDTICSNVTKHCIFFLTVYLVPKQTTVISLYTITPFVFIVDTASVYCEVRTECLSMN